MSAPPSPPAPPAAAIPGDEAGQRPSHARAPIDSRTLFDGATEVQIAHRGALYRLKQTALGKLILTK